MFNRNSYHVFLKLAGQLFADHGYANISLEEIAEASGISLDDILHRFGNKDKLYAHVFYMMLESDRLSNIDSIVREHPDWAFTRWGQSRIIRRKIRYLFENLFSDEYPWKIALMAQEMSSPVLKGENQLDYIHRELYGDLECFYRHIRPDLSSTDLYYCCSLPMMYMNFFLMKAPTLPETWPAKNIPLNRRIRELAEFTITAVLRFLGLPEEGEDDCTNESREYEALNIP